MGLSCAKMIDEQYMPTHFDILLTDVHARDLHQDISRRLQVIYLADHVGNNCIDNINGIIWGPHNRIFVPTVVRMGNKQKNVHMLVDTGSPNTYLSNEVFAAFDRMIYNPSNPVSVNINGKQITVLQSPETSHFTDVNILGSDYLKTYNAIVTIDYVGERIQIGLQD